MTSLELAAHHISSIGIMHCLINAVLEEDGEMIQIEKLISVTPQRHHGGLGQRGCRIGIEVVTRNNERVIIEVQMSPESWILLRSLFSASRVFTETSVPGDTSHEMAERLPRIIVINIINFVLRDDNMEVMQPVKIVFTKEPRRVAVPNLKLYNVQLPLIEKMEENFDNAWYCWFYALHKADSENKTLNEVMEMTPQLQKYSKKDAGFRQYCEQYGRVASDPETRKEYLDWFEDMLREESVKHAAKEAEEFVRREATVKGRIDGRREGRLEGRLEADGEWQMVVAEKDALIAELRAKLDDNK